MRRFLTHCFPRLSVCSFALTGTLAIVFGLTSIASAQNGNKKVKNTTVTTTTVNSNNGNNSGKSDDKEKDKDKDKDKEKEKDKKDKDDKDKEDKDKKDKDKDDDDDVVGGGGNPGGVGDPVPEIDPNSMTAALALLVGGVLCLTDPRRRQRA